MILLDTNAVIWLLTDHPRGKSFQNTDRLYLSPVSVLELQFLVEVGRLQLSSVGKKVKDIVNDSRWQLDNPSSSALFDSALVVAWTRDPFDRLLVAHALYRHWRLATGDKHILANISASSTYAL